MFLAAPHTFREVPHTHRAQFYARAKGKPRVGMEIAVCLTSEITGLLFRTFGSDELSDERDERLDVTKITITQCGNS